MRAALPAAPPAAAEASAAGLGRSLGGGLVMTSLLLLVAPGLTRNERAGARDRGRVVETTPERTPAPLVEARGVGRSFGARVALTDVSFMVRPGEAVALWGANGAGKTTLLRALLGVMPFEGEVHVAGLDVRRQGRQARRLIGFVPQEIAFPEMTAGEALTLFARLHGAPPQRIGELAERLGLQGELDKRVQELSGGRKQRLALAVALVADPPLLLLDEPSSSLDAAARRELADHLLALKGEGKTLIFSSHRADEVMRLADRVIHLEDGRLVCDVEPLPLWNDELETAAALEKRAAGSP
jgi:ABC-type multidrug transport system ATPase subunit